MALMMQNIITFMVGFFQKVIFMKKICHALFVHVIPVTLMIVVMAYAMIYVSQRLN